MHRVLGIPNRGRDILYGLDDESIASVLDKHGVDSRPSMASLEKSIKLMKSADEHFLRTFIVLVLSWSALLWSSSRRAFLPLTRRTAQGAAFSISWSAFCTMIHERKEYE
ncbi:hypothetical protein ZWY2020_027386 [Hordeum vulgare]|nr:hypothetical protein ZWY2020_027386 [Hordeum vulgare]